MFVRNVLSGAWDRLDYRATALDIYNGALIGGDPLSANVFTLFSASMTTRAPSTITGRTGSSTLAPTISKWAHQGGADRPEVGRLTITSGVLGSFSGLELYLLIKLAFSRQCP